MFTKVIYRSKIKENVINTKNSEYIQVYCPKDLKGRLKSGGFESTTQLLSILIETLLKPLEPTLRAYIKDNWDSLRKLPPKIPFREHYVFLLYFQFAYFNIHWTLSKRGWEKMLVTMVAQRQKVLKLRWPKCHKTFAKKTKLGPEINDSKLHICSLSINFRFSGWKCQSQ